MERGRVMGNRYDGVSGLNACAIEVEYYYRNEEILGGWIAIVFYNGDYSIGLPVDYSVARSLAVACASSSCWSMIEGTEKTGAGDGFEEYTLYMNFDRVKRGY